MGLAGRLKRSCQTASSGCSGCTCWRGESWQQSCCGGAGGLDASIRNHMELGVCSSRECIGPVGTQHRRLSSVTRCHAYPNPPAAPHQPPMCGACNPSFQSLSNAPLPPSSPLPRSYWEDIGMVLTILFSIPQQCPPATLISAAQLLGGHWYGARLLRVQPRPHRLA